MSYYGGSGNIDLRPIYKEAIDLIYADYGDRVSIKAKKKRLRKWGSTTAVSTSRTVVMTMKSGIAEETMLTSNGITTVISDSGSDTMDIDFYEGHTYSAGNLTFVVENTNTTLTGTTAATLPTALARSTRARLTAPANGNIYFYEGGATSGGIPTDGTEVHLIIPAGEIQTQKNSTSISSVDYWIIEHAFCSVLSKTSAWVQARIEIKAASATYFYPITGWTGISDSSGKRSLLDDDEFLIIPKNHDVRMVIEANTGGVLVAGEMSGPLASVL